MGPGKHDTIVVMPSYNEEKTIFSLARKVSGMGYKVLVVDDGSSDGTADKAVEGGAELLRNEENKGKGFSLEKAVRYVLERTRYEWLIVMDADGQHDPEDIPALVETVSAEDADIVVGNRMDRSANMPLDRYLTNKFTSWVVSLFCRTMIPDAQCGFRLFSAESLRKINIDSKKYDVESEMLIKGARQGLRIVSVPVKTIYGGERSNIKPIRDTLKFFALVLRSIFWKNDK